ncbi:MAG: type II toxin-antitoxin system VapC family toxin [Kiritimatiellae bacterium]|nr:type II toxin-antitoxin system VapC family toxin [Kiritimatiellia bacterium]
MKYLIDTCVASESAKRTPSGAVTQWFASVPAADVFIPSVALGELYKGISRLAPDDPRRPRLVDWLENLRNVFAGRIVAFDERAAVTWGRLCGEAERAGRKRPSIDAQIAAIALANGMTLVTRNVDDMAGFDAPIFNPFPP